jgi:hypothetical protein
MTRSGFIVVLVAVVVACGQSQEVASQSHEARMAGLDARIRTAIGAAACIADTQCKALAFGEKPCGGPAQYLAYSTQATDVLALESLAAQHRTANIESNKVSGRMSNCMVIAEPALACKAGKCVVAD